MRRAAVLFLALWVSTLTGCAILSKGERSVPRYFDPNLPDQTAPGEGKHPELALRLGRVTAGAHLGERIVFRESEYELGYYEDRLWTERPVAYLRRALHRILFEEEGLRSVLSGGGPALDVELLSFEEVLKPRHLAVVRLGFSLNDSGAVRMQRTLTVERPIAAVPDAERPDALAKALGDALRAAVSELATLVITDLRQTPEPPASETGT